METNLNSKNSSLKQLSATPAELLDAIFRVFPDLLFSLDEKGRIIGYRVGRMANLYLSPEQFMGRTLAEILPPETGLQLERGLADALNLGQVVSIEYRMEVQNVERWFEAHIVPNERRGAIAIIRDISGRVKATAQIQRQLRRMSALHSIDAAITASFDLNVTLSVILRQVISQLGADAADILLFNPITHLLEYAAGLGFRTHSLHHVPVMLGQGFAGTAALERRTVSIPDLESQLEAFHSTPNFMQERFASYHAVPLIAKGQVKGVMEIYQRSLSAPDEEWVEFLATLAGQAAVAIDSASLFQELQRSNAELTLAYDTAIETWAQFLEASGRESREHTFRVVDLSIRLAQAMRVKENELIHYRRGALLHDIGKVSIPEAIINKPGHLDEAEWRIVRNYPAVSYQMLACLQQLGPALDIPRYHHERWDGSGYPYELCGEQIPLAARIVGLVDVYDALQTPRPYRRAWSREAALVYIRRQAGILFDPNMVKVFLGMMEKNGP